MKKTILITIIAIGALMVSNKSQAQSNWEAGIRFGDGFSFDVTVPLKSPRVHLAAYTEGAFALGAYFDWLFTLDGGPAGLKFYPGVGPEFVFANDFGFNIAGDFGVEYSFDFPLTVGLDWRPGFQVTNDFNYYGGNWGILARFRFSDGVSFSKTK